MCSNIKNERGNALIISILILFLLTLLGMFATNTSNMELLVSGNERAYKQTFYNADAGVYYALLGQHTGSETLPGTPEVTLTYSNLPSPAGAPTRVEVESKAVGPNGTESKIIAGIEFTAGGKLPGPGNETDF